MMQVQQSEPDSSLSIQRQKSCDYDRKNAHKGPGSKLDLRQDPPNLPPPPVPVMRCLRCNTRIPEMDYLYTKKTGLCIPCWEEQVV